MKKLNHDLLIKFKDKINSLLHALRDAMRTRNEKYTGRILLVAPDQNWPELVSYYLKEKGFDVFVLDGENTYFFIKNKTIIYDLIIIDEEVCFNKTGFVDINNRTYYISEKCIKIKGNRIAELSKKIFPNIPILGYSDYPHPLKHAMGYINNPMQGGLTKNIERAFQKHVINKGKKK